MKERNTFSAALVEVDWDSDAPPALHCPITGQIVAIGYDPETGDLFEGQQEPKWEAIPTVLFHYYPEVGEFSYIKPDLQKTIEEKRRKLGEEAEDLEDFEILAEHIESLGKIPLVFALTTHGMATGPVSSTVYVGLDLAAGSKEDP
jgi:hypothetical protein